MPDIPAPLTYGTVTGRFISVVGDSGDAGLSPDVMPLNGTVTLTPVLAQYRIVGPPTQLVIATAVTAKVTNGDLLTTAGTPVTLLASDSPGINPSPLQYTAQFNLTGVKAQPTPVVFDVPSGGTVDIGAIISLPAATPVQTVVSEDTRIAAEAAAVRAEAAATGTSSVQADTLFAKRESIFATPPVLSDAPKVTTRAQSAITNNIIVPVHPPKPGSCDAGPARMVGLTIPGYYSNRPESTGNGVTTLSAAARAGDTSIQIALPLETDKDYGLSPVYSDVSNFNATSGFTQDNVESAETIRITSITGSAAPYTAQLAAPLAHNHWVAERVTLIVVPDPGYNRGTAVANNSYTGSTATTSIEWETDAPIVELFTYVGNGNFARVWVDGQLVTGPLPTWYTVELGGTNSDGSAQPTNNMAAFLSVNFGTREWRRIKIDYTGSIHPIGISVGVTDAYVAQEDPAVRALFIGDSFLQGVEIQAHVARNLGWDGVWTDAIGGTGYEADNVANIGTLGRAQYRAPIWASVRPDVIVIALGLNDSYTDTLQATVENVIRLARQATKGPIFVAGPWSNGNGSNSSKRDVAQAILAAVNAIADPKVLYVDTMLGLGAAKNPWVTGTGYLGNERHDGNADYVVDGDGTHPQPLSGATYYGMRLAQGIWQANTIAVRK